MGTEHAERMWSVCVCRRYLGRRVFIIITLFIHLVFYPSWARDGGTSIFMITIGVIGYVRWSLVLWRRVAPPDCCQPFVYGYGYRALLNGGG